MNDAGKYARIEYNINIFPLIGIKLHLDIHSHLDKSSTIWFCCPSIEILWNGKHFEIVRKVRKNSGCFRS